MANYGSMAGDSYNSAVQGWGNPVSRPTPTATVSSGSSGWGTLFSFLGAAAQVYSSYKSVEIQTETARNLNAASARSSELNAQSRAEQQAQNSAQAASERRQQLREERVRRGKLMQAGVNTGTAYSSGEAGAAGGLSTQLSSNLGSNLGAVQAATNISNNSQEAATIMGNAENAARSNNVQASIWSGVGSLGGSVFQASGGFNSLFSGLDWSQSPAPVVDKSTKS